MKSKILVVLGTLLFLFLAIIITGYFWGMSHLTTYVRSQVTEKMKEGCPQCKFEMGDVRVHPFDGSASVDSVFFESDHRGMTIEKVKVEEISVKADLARLKKHEIYLDELKLTGLTVNLEEIHDDRPETATAADLARLEKGYGGKIFESLPPMTIHVLELADAKLEYRMKIYGKLAPLDVSEINATVSEFGTRKELSPKIVRAQLLGKFQNSGKVIFDCEADLFSVKNDDHIKLNVEHLKLPEINSFFQKEDGIEFSGDLEYVRTDVHLRNGIMTGQLSTKYQGLKLKTLSTPERGKFAAGLMNFMSGVKFSENKPEEGKSIPVIEVGYNRKPGQGIVKFILMGLKEAAIKAVAKQPR